jgi:putative DNA primase/helicase
LTPSDLKNDLVRHLQNNYCEIKSGDVTSVLMNAAARCGVLSLRTPPVWLDGVDHAAKTWTPEETFATRSHFINLRLLCDGQPDAIVPTSPSYFSFTAADYEFNVKAPPPTRWLAFLNQLWPEDPQSIHLLRQWMGYNLTADTSQQKILLMVGPKRSGKGTCARIIRSIVGDRNCCAPTLSGLSTNFGLSPLLGKSVAIIGDARLSRRTDIAAVTERLPPALRRIRRRRGRPEAHSMRKLRLIRRNRAMELFQAWLQCSIMICGRRLQPLNTSSQ